jgi:hypothetical protein
MGHSGFRKSTAEIELRFSRKMVKTCRNLVLLCFSTCLFSSYFIYLWPKNDGLKIALGIFIANLLYSILEYRYCLTEYKVDKERYNRWDDIEHHQYLENTELTIYKDNFRILSEENKELREKLKAQGIDNVTN